MSTFTNTAASAPLNARRYGVARASGSPISLGSSPRCRVRGCPRHRDDSGRAA